MIDRETVQKIKDAANIVEVVGDYVNLVRRGANYMGLCPFHNERTPSFSVSPRRNFCYCFSCKKGGSPVNFLMEKEGLSYHDALLQLAKKYNIHVEERDLTDEEKARMSAREAMMVANEWAMNHFHDNLFNTEEGRDIGLSYLYGRGITDEAIRQYKIGYSIDRGNALFNAALKNGFDIEVLKEAGLVGTSQEGRNYDKFRGRVIFPIRNASGKVVAFGGRALKGEPAKYINSPETILYTKSNELYGIYEAKPNIIREEKVYLMEGYLDVVGSWQSGITNAVASSGTALTDGQINLLHRFTENVTLIYDGDMAGLKAALRGLDMLLAHKLNVKLLLLPEGEDPDSFARKNTPEEYRKYISKNEQDIIEFKAEVLLKDAGDDPTARSQAIESVIRSISCIPSEIKRSVYIQKCSEKFGVDERVVARGVAKAFYDRMAEKGKNRGIRNPEERQDFSSSISGTLTGAMTREKEPERPRRSDLYNWELPLIKYCVRYAFFPWDSNYGAEEVYNEAEQLVIDYINEELEADNLEFTHPVYNDIFRHLLDSTHNFRDILVDFRERQRMKGEEEMRQYFDSKSISGGSLAELKHGEEQFREKQRERNLKELFNFASQYSCDILLNHENDEIRKSVLPLVEEPHRLSAIYSNQTNINDREEYRLSTLVPRALAELKGAILNNRVRELNAKIASLSGSDDKETLAALTDELARTLYIRSKIASGLGERIISPN